MLYRSDITDVLSEKFKQTKEIENDYFSKRKSLYFKMIAGLTIALLLLPFYSIEIISSDLFVNIWIIGILILLAFSMTLLKIYEEKIDYLFWFVYTDYKKLTDNKKNIIEYIKQEDIQVEIFNFAEKHATVINLYDFKKSFAFNDYNKAFKVTRELFDFVRKVDESVEAREKEEKHIRDYELNIRMKL